MLNKVKCPIGVTIFPEPLPNRPRTVSYTSYICAMLDYAGICYRKVSCDEMEGALPELKILLTVGECDLGSAKAAALDNWIRSGGSWISIAGVCGLADTLGVSLVKPGYSGWGIGESVQLGEGYLAPCSSDDATLSHLDCPLHFFNGLAVESAGAEVLARVLDPHQRDTRRAAMTRARLEKGEAYFIAADISGAVVHIQQGVAITRDGVPTGDGTAPLCDNALKTDDGCVLDRYFDRHEVDGVPGLSAYLRPVVDQWRELILRTLFACASRLDLALPVLWLYPRKLPAIAHISHDTDENDPACAQKMLDVLAANDIHSTWCTIVPGYSPSLTDQITKAGHEQAMHYDAVSNDWSWSHDSFIDQNEELTRLFGHRPISNKNHFLRWEGDTEFFEWCLQAGIEIDQSKGPSKPGVAGFLFGTSHPYFPVDFKGNQIDVIELPTLAQDLAVFIPTAFVEPLFKQVLRSHGVLHLLFHPAHIIKPGVPEAIGESNRLVRSEGMEWWTASEINTWHRDRLTMAWGDWAETDKGLDVHFRAGKPLESATLLVLGANRGIGVAKDPNPSVSTMKCWGYDFSSIEVTIDADTDETLKISDAALGNALSACGSSAEIAGS